MKNSLKILVLTGLFLNQLSFGAVKTVKVHVTGMVCAFCAQGITKRLKTLENVENINVSLEKKLVSFALPENSQVTDEQIKTVITQAGMNVESIER